MHVGSPLCYFINPAVSKPQAWYIGMGSKVVIVITGFGARWSDCCTPWSQAASNRRGESCLGACVGRRSFCYGGAGDDALEGGHGER